MAEIEDGEILTYEEWRERLTARAASTGWKIPDEVRTDVVQRLVATIRDPETPFQSFIKAVDMLAKLDRAESQSVTNAFKVTQWALADAANDIPARNGVRAHEPRWPGPYQEELERLADRMEEFGISKALADQVRNFDLSDMPEPQVSEDLESLDFTPTQTVGERSV